MRSPLGSIVSNVFVGFEYKFVTKQPLYYKRYVHYTFAVFTDDIKKNSL